MHLEANMNVTDQLAHAPLAELSLSVLVVLPCVMTHASDSLDESKSPEQQSNRLALALAGITDPGQLTTKRRHL